MANAVFALIFLVAAHYAGDYFFQKWTQEALEGFHVEYGKERNWYLSLHCAFYVLPFAPVFFFFHIPWFWLLFLFFSHFAVDRALLGMKRKNGNVSAGYLKRLMALDRVLITDQGLHFLCIFIVFISWII